MVTKRALKAAIRSDCLDAVGSLVPPENILYTAPDERVDGGSDDSGTNTDTDDFPRITYSVFESPVRYNRGSKPQPYKVALVDGTPQTEIYATFYKLRCELIVEGTSADCDAIYEQLKTYWVAYELFKDDTDLHADVTDIAIDGSDETVITDTEPSVYESLLPVIVEYRQDVTRDGVPITNIYHHLDVDPDGSTDVTYITNESNS